MYLYGWGEKAKRRGVPAVKKRGKSTDYPKRLHLDGGGGGFVFH